MNIEVEAIRCPVTGVVLWEPRYGLIGDIPFFSRYLSDFEELDILGSGGYGCVCLARHRLDRKDYAIKKILVSPTLKSVMTEVNALCHLEHQHIVRYYQVWMERSHSGIFEGDFVSVQSEGNSGSVQSEGSDESVPHKDVEPSKVLPCLYIQMEYCPSSLDKFLEPPDYQLCEETAWKLFRQLLEGLEHIHSKGIIHRDLSKLNIFLDDFQNIKIGDFGLAKLKEGDDYSPNSRGKIGTPLYKSPELSIPGSKIDTKADIYSLGIIFFELFYPFKTATERIHVLTLLRDRKKVPKDWKFIYQTRRLTSFVEDNPQERPSASEILLMQPWSLSEGHNLQSNDSDADEHA